MSIEVAAMMDRESMDAIVRGGSTISAKIRALDKAGVARADIARFLNRRYQHVRNVLEADRLRVSGQSVREATSTPTQSPVSRPKLVGPFFRLQTHADGSLLIPAHILGRVEVAGDDVLIGTIKDGQLTLTSAEEAMTSAQELVARLLPGDDSLAESLISDRCREAEEEGADG